ncbi:helix-turn-helix domain-containing protein [Flavobacterium sp. 14A]|uniref:XRE family transcriptional regulator n=1 Tax=Flavobacterium sp. 14A TaxID=2735896 RepID=UPI00156E253A|nr:helix-turn-helix domain-containing protein [Flavobacterium sp. 14A]NRT10456.1 transcriptional regulator with XRE-family HTH domain [Flavobacterium sp. 14A]
MSIFSDNIRNLRIKRKISQEKLAESLAITRGRYVKYEDGTSEAPYDILKKIAQYYHISIDLLLSVDVRKVPIDELLKLEDNRILLPITVNKDGDNFIEIIPHKARAGYLSGYSDPEFIENLQQISLPWLRNGKFRAFPVDGDSMPPHKSGFYIVGRYIETLGEVRDGKTYILLTKNEGIVYKRLNKNGKNALVLHSDNAYYKSYEVKASEILEIWEFACSLATEEFTPDDLTPESLKDVLMDLRREVREVRAKLA